MSWKMMDLVLDNKALEPGAKLVMVVYARHANDQGEDAFPAVETIQEQSSLSERACRSWIKWLQDKQYLIKTGRRPHGNNIYRLNIPLLKEGANSAPQQGATDAPPAEKEGANSAPQQEEGAKSAPLGVQNLHPRGAKSAPEEVLNQSLNRSIEEEEVPPTKTPTAAPAPAGQRRPVTEEDALRVWTQITGMMAVPGGADAATAILGKILSIADKYGERTAEFLLPYYQAHSLSKTQSGRQYSKTKVFWLDTWAVAEEIPEAQLSQIRSLPADKIPPELRTWMEQRKPNGKPMVKAGGPGMTPEELEEAGQYELQKLMQRQQRNQPTGGTNGK